MNCFLIFHERMDDAQSEEVAESVRSLIVSDDDFHPPPPSELRVLRMVASSIEGQVQARPELAAEYRSNVQYSYCNSRFGPKCWSSRTLWTGGRAAEGAPLLRA